VRVDLAQFERAYHRNTDPWDFASSPYEQRKYEVTLASLPHRRYQRCFEPGCSIGALTSRLATRADNVVAIDASATAVATASKRLRSFANVNIAVGALPDQWPTGTFDLLVWSELGYYWDEAELPAIIEQARTLLRREGHFAAVHWLGHSDDHLLNGNDVHAVIAWTLGKPIVRHRESQFVLDIWEPR
jgi:SAM-dependent methyltransferase